MTEKTMIEVARRLGGTYEHPGYIALQNSDRTEWAIGNANDTLDMQRQTPDKSAVIATIDTGLPRDTEDVQLLVDTFGWYARGFENSLQALREHHFEGES